MSSKNRNTIEAIDLLVDGQLPEEERRALLVQLDQDPDGWRRCALAFLEAQCLREAFGEFGATQRSPVTSSPPTLEVQRFPFRPKMLSIALAASITGFAFTLGWLCGGQGSWDGRTARPQNQLVQHNEPATDDKPLDSLSGQEESIGRNTQGSSKTQLHDLSSVVEIGLVQVPTTSDDTAVLVDVPIFAGPGLDERWLRDQPTFVPRDVSQRWEADGYQVGRQRRLVSVQVDDEGRYLTIPVDEVLLLNTTKPSITNVVY